MDQNEQITNSYRVSVYMRGIVLDVADTIVNKTSKAPALSKFTSILVEQTGSIKL